MRVKLTLFYLLVLMLPVQLGRHFFFAFSNLGGIRSDYLTPILYLSDIFILLLISVEFTPKIIKRSYKKPSFTYKYLFLLFVICYLLFNLFIAANKWAAFYLLVRLVIFVLLGWTIVRIKPKLEKTLSVLSIASLYSSIIALWQFIIQKSIGGLFWWLGERTFSLSTPGIAAFTIPFSKFGFFGFNQLGHKLVLRSYATFPHPNVLAGFLAVTLPAILYLYIKKDGDGGRLQRLFILTSFILGFFALITTFSKAGFFVFLLGVSFAMIFGKNGSVLELLQKKSRFVLSLFYFLIFLSAAVLIAHPQKLWLFGQNWEERAVLMKGALDMIIKKPILGYGFNNFIVQSSKFVPASYYLLSHQPVHNIFILIFVETGIMGFIIFTSFLACVFLRALYKKPLMVLLLAQLYFLAFFDHYLLTLQQGQLLFVIFISFAFLNASPYTKKKTS